MNQPKGTIYIRDNEWYKKENVVKLGIASFAKDRNSTYITGEIIRGKEDIRTKKYIFELL
jgi:glycine cleavage system H lipoate-binding protein